MSKHAARDPLSFLDATLRRSKLRLNVWKLTDFPWSRPQAGDAADAELPDAGAAGAAGVEEPDGPVRHAALPEREQDPVVHPGEEDRRLKWTTEEVLQTREQAEEVIVVKYTSLNHNNGLFLLPFAISKRTCSANCRFAAQNPNIYCLQFVKKGR